MPVWRYRAVTPAGAPRSGLLEGGSSARVVEDLRRLGLLPIEVGEAPAAEAGPERLVRPSRPQRRAAVNAMAELAVLLGAGLTLDRALAVCVETVPLRAPKAAFAAVHRRVQEGATFSRALAEAGGLFPPMAAAMAEAGEANGRLDVSLARLAETLERREALRQTIEAAMVYPVLLLAIASAVILMMLLWVVPQFESLFDEAGARLPPTTRLIMALSHATRAHGLVALAAAAVALFLANVWRRRPDVRAWSDRTVLRLPALGGLVSGVEVGGFARVLGALVDGGVALPDAVAIARGTLGNGYIAAAMGRVALALRQGRGLTVSLAAEGAFPRSALSFVRTGEETARLGPMLGRLADVLDRETRLGVERFIAVLTPLITVLMGGIVATVIASIMTAILGFNDLALAP